MQKPQLKYRIKKFVKAVNQTIIVTIGLDDDCNNGYADFSITANIHTGTICSNHNYIMGGCCHDEILKVFPEFKLFVDLHLSDMFGSPMYAHANGYYHLRNEHEKTPGERKVIVKEYMRIGNALFDILNTAEDEEHFHFLIDALKLPTMWKIEADAAIAQLEKLTGKKWDRDYKWSRFQYKPLLAEDKKKMQQRLDSGYYTSTAIQRRLMQAAEDKYNKKLAKLKVEAAKDIYKIMLERDLYLWLYKKAHTLKKKFAKQNIEFNLFVENSIYYNHTNNINFNWVNWQGKTTKKNFKRFIDSITEAEFQTKLPHDISITIRKM